MDHYVHGFLLCLTHLSSVFSSLVLAKAAPYVNSFSWNIGAPTLFCIVWIAIWGGTTVWLQYTGIMDVWQSVNEKGLEVTIFTILSTLPFAKILAASS